MAPATRHSRRGPRSEPASAMETSFKEKAFEHLFLSQSLEHCEKKTGCRLAFRRCGCGSGTFGNLSGDRHRGPLGHDARRQWRWRGRPAERQGFAPDLGRQWCDAFGFYCRCRLLLHCRNYRSQRHELEPTRSRGRTSKPSLSNCTG